MGELKLLRAFRKGAPKHPWLRVGPGSDCAVLEWKPGRDLVYKIDQVVEGTHFVLSGREAATPREIGWKAMAKACSDIAAAGAWPVAATVAVNLRKGTPERVAMELYRGITACCRKYRFALAGGDFATSPQGMSVVVSLVGECPKGKAWTRSGAKPGDYLFVTGPLGGSRAKKHLTFQPRLEAAREIRKRLGNGVHACIDITDGLSRDLHHLCAESRVGAVLFETLLPYSAAARRIARSGRSALDQALSDGEDFELLLAVAPSALAALRKRERLRLPIHVIGRVSRAGRGVIIQRASGGYQRLADIGYEHRT